MSTFFKDLEAANTGTRVPLTDFIAELPFNQDGLLPVIAQQYDTKEVLMMAWVNAEALRITLESQVAVYWSRSRNALWRKGESSGQTQTLKSVRFDCDGDTLLYSVDQTGPACHTGRRDCFYYVVEGDSVAIDKSVLVDPKTLYNKSL